MFDLGLNQAPFHFLAAATGKTAKGTFREAIDVIGYVAGVNPTDLVVGHRASGFCNLPDSNTVGSPFFGDGNYAITESYI
jgi:hypothetical protein